MSEPPVSEAEQRGELSPDGRVLLVMIASDHAMFDELITALLDIGLTGATVIESRGMGSILREEMPIFAGLASLIPEHTGSRALLSVTTREQAGRVFQYIDTELKVANRPIAVTIPIENAAGLLR
jgi:nitrogen regulatory protein P-II 1